MNLTTPPEGLNLMFMDRGREEKPHIGIYGRCNVGKSTLLNFLTQTRSSIVAATGGTTTDPVRKSFEILGFAPVVLIDTAGIDDRTPLGLQRQQATQESIAQIDLAILVISEGRWGAPEIELAERFQHEAVNFVAVHNTFVGRPEPDAALRKTLAEHYEVPLFEIDLHETTLNTFREDPTSKRDQLLEILKNTIPEKSRQSSSLFEGIVAPGDVVLLVCPIDAEAPTGRLILPQVKAIRDLLDHRAAALVIQPETLPTVLRSGLRPRLVVTDSQVIAKVRAQLPAEIELTSFSMLLARLKGDYETYRKGLAKIDHLKNGDHILMLENCVHQTSCADIGRVKIPTWLRKKSGKKLEFSFVSGLSPLPDNITDFALVIQCGGCMITRSQLLNRIRAVTAAGVPITNYGMAIQKLQLE